MTSATADLQTLWAERGCSVNRVTRAAIDILAAGAPATPHALAVVTDTRLDQVEGAIESARTAGVEVEDGAIVGAALTLRPTEHRFRVRGNDLYTWCGFDALFLPIMLGERAEVMSTCPVTGVDIRLTVEPNGTVSAATPAGGVVGIVGREITSCCTGSGPGSDVCTQMPFLASRDAGERWLAGHPGVAIVDLDDARGIAHAYVAGAERLRGREAGLVKPG